MRFNRALDRIRGGPPATRAKAARGRARTPKAIAKPSSRLALISHEVLLECDASSHRFRENSNWRVASAESAFQSRIGQNSWRGSSHASKSGAKTRTHSQSYRKTRKALPRISHEVLLECDASSHRFWENSNFSGALLFIITATVMDCPILSDGA